LVYKGKKKGKELSFFPFLTLIHSMAMPLKAEAFQMALGFCLFGWFC